MSRGPSQSKVARAQGVIAVAARTVVLSPVAVRVAVSPLGVEVQRVVLRSVVGSLSTLRGGTQWVLVAAEIVAATEGIGWVVWDASKFMRSDIIFVGIITMGITGIALDGCIRGVAKRLLRWKYV